MQKKIWVKVKDDKLRHLQSHVINTVSLEYLLSQGAMSDTNRYNEEGHAGLLRSIYPIRALMKQDSGIFARHSSMALL